MELNYNLVRYGTLKVLKVTGTYPSDDNCYHVEVSMRGEKHYEKHYEDHYCPKPVYQMWKALHVLADLLSRERIVELIEAFNAHGQWNYYQGGIEESMANSEDL